MQALDDDVPAAALRRNDDDGENNNTANDDDDDEANATLSTSGTVRTLSASGTSKRRTRHRAAGRASIVVAAQMTAISARSFVANAQRAGRTVAGKRRRRSDVATCNAHVHARRVSQRDANLVKVKHPQARINSAEVFALSLFSLNALFWLRRPQAAKFLIEYENALMMSGYKFGVCYAAPGQVSRSVVRRASQSQRERRAAARPVDGRGHFGQSRAAFAASSVLVGAGARAEA